MHPFLRVSGLVFLISALVNCSSVPITGRKQLNFIPKGQIHRMSFSNYQQVLSQAKLSQDAAKTKLIKRVGVRIQKAVEKYFRQKNMGHLLHGYQWEFNLIEDDKMVNAWAMPGGKVAFYTGILPICQDETGIAVVMGHTHYVKLLLNKILWNRTLLHFSTFEKLS